MFLAGDSQGVGNDQQVCVVKEGHLRPLHQHDESELDEQHESQLPDAADVEEHRAGQQGQQYTVAEILQQRGGSEEGGRFKVNIQTYFSRSTLKNKHERSGSLHQRTHELKCYETNLREMAGHGLTRTQSQTVFCCLGQVVKQAESH